MSPYVFVIPIVVVFSVVYSASRYESWSRIWPHAFRLTGLILGILLAITAILLVVNTRV